ncbi:hydrolase, alpha/beta fold family protein [Enhygromyxa salina]|uniref:Hydrolase, alpha/beta fold family protein n=1 Tax=Enhygromyxa salina TaxID=215803 RepID=A0A0C1Z9F9_9BACT|nr:alpha/beta hydrolase [Enhygromyxa salina]KIG14194.1 hydrolase, alpha/beta fold family protein [Enhygromyxa salina]
MPEALELDIGTKLAALAWGPADGRPVLASHGWLDNAATMSRLAPMLCDALGLRIISLDLPGHGLSEHKRGPYHFIDSVADVIHAADALGWERFSLLGHSMGAGISTLVAGTVPDRIERCVLLEGLGPMADDAGQAARRLGRSLRIEATKRHKAKRSFEHPDIAVARLREVAKMDLESARILLGRGLVQLEDGWTWRADPGLRLDSRLRLTEEQVRAFLVAIKCPVLLVSASEGWPHDPKLMRARVEAVATLEIAQIQGLHHVHLDDPEGVAALVIPFMRPLVEDAGA